MTSRIGSLAIVTLLLVACLPALRGDSISSGEWPNYGNDAGGTRYSPLTQIDRENVGRLRVAWTYRTGETVGVPSPWAHYAFEATPLMVDGTLLFSTPYNRVIALDAETGTERWAWDAKVDRTRRVAIATSRGVSTWLDAEARADRTCRRRIFVGTIDARLVALDAATGVPCADFGRSGQVASPSSSPWFHGHGTSRNAPRPRARVASSLRSTARPTGCIARPWCRRAACRAIRRRGAR